LLALAVILSLLPLVSAVILSLLVVNFLSNFYCRCIRIWLRNVEKPINIIQHLSHGSFFVDVHVEDPT
jgi:hypothetical protein